jgi:UDP-N-acetylmuramoyl-L-alanyl-D-glutamate--2,6-diaminopimelate ligase
MLLRDLLGEAAGDVEIEGLAYDNRRVGPGTLFFCVPGFTRDGHDFAPDAVARGAAALVVARPLELDVPQVLVEDVRTAMATAAARFCGDPTGSLPVVGITGTNGKTTTAFLIRSLLEAAGRPCGLLGTVKSVVGGTETATERTTPEAIDLQPVFRAMLDGGDTACAMEVSSHALELRRVEGIHFAAALFTNLTQDHLDFHPTMEDYFEAKARLFAGTPQAPGVRIVNVDDAYGRRLADRFPGTVTYAVDGRADYEALDVRTGFAGSEFGLRTPEGDRLAVARRCPGASTSRTCSGRSPSCAPWGVPTRRSSARCRRPGACPGASSRSRRGRSSRCWSTTPTPRTRSRTSCWRAASSPRAAAAACSASSAAAATATAASGR